MLHAVLWETIEMKLFRQSLRYSVSLCLRVKVSVEERQIFAVNRINKMSLN